MKYTEGRFYPFFNEWGKVSGFQSFKVSVFQGCFAAQAFEFQLNKNFRITGYLPIVCFFTHNRQIACDIF